MPTLDWIGMDAVVKHHMDVPYRLKQLLYFEIQCASKFINLAYDQLKTDR